MVGRAEKKTGRSARGTAAEEKKKSAAMMRIRVFNDCGGKQNVSRKTSCGGGDCAVRVQETRFIVRPR